MSYTAEQIQSFRDELTALRDARTKLLSGRLVARIVIDGEVAEYHRVDIKYLNTRIGELQTMIASVDAPDDAVTAFVIRSGKGL